jgi:hypothetical protein
VARRALALVLAIGELTLMRVLMAIDALCESDRLLEISVRVALDAVNIRVFAEQREFGLRMVKSVVFRHFFPARGCMTRFARLRKRTVVRIPVAVAAFRKRDARESRLTAWSGRRVAFLAGYLRMKPRQRVARFVVIELLRCFPIHEIVALEAILAELPLVRIVVAGNAILRQSKERAVQILRFNLRPLRFADVRGRVALAAIYLSVFALQRIAGLSVIESF